MIPPLTPDIPCQKHSPTSIHADYIYHKNEKGKLCEMDLPFLKNDITNNLEPQKPVIYSRKHRYWIEDFKAKS